MPLSGAVNTPLHILMMIENKPETSREEEVE
jgi:hypothetical protein